MSKEALEQYKPEYHQTSAPYILPADSQEQHRLLLQHDAWVKLMNGDFLHAPVSDPKLIVDIGCGPGAVTKPLGTRFPSAKVYGLDLISLADAAHAERPANVEFIQGDARDLLKDDPRLGPHRVDFAFQRLLVCGMTDWAAYIQTLADAVAPGAWIEMQEWDYHVFRDDGTDVTDEWPWQREMVRRSRETKGLDLRCATKLADWMRQAGLVDVTTVKYRATIGLWDVEQNPQTRAKAEYMHDWYPSICWTLIANSMKGVVGEEEIRAHQEQMLKDLEKAEKEERKFFEITVCYARKP